MNRQKKIILVVDDSALVLERVVPMLQRIENVGLVMSAGSYKEAVELLADVSPDMVLLDINLPDKSGIELLRKIRQTNKQIIVFMVSNTVNDQYKKACKQIGAEYFFDKSDDFDIVSKAIAGH